MTRPHLWNDKESQKLIAYQHQDVSWQEISTRLNRKERACRDHLRQLKQGNRIKNGKLVQKPIRSLPKRWSDEETQELLTYRLNGVNWREISTRLNREEKPCRDHLRQLKQGNRIKNGKLVQKPIRSLPQRWSDKETQELLAYQHEGVSWREVSTRLNREEGACRSHFHHLKQGNRIKDGKLIEKLTGTLSSQWSDEEIKKLIAYRHKGFSWRVISTHLHPRTEKACARYFHDLEKEDCIEEGIVWDEQKKNQLAEIYERKKEKVWKYLTKEMDIPWGIAEDMHWEMGKLEMALRAEHDST